MDYAFADNEAMAYSAPPCDPLSETLSGQIYIGTPPVTPFEWSPPPEYTGNPLGMLPLRNPSYDEAISQMNRVERKTEQLEVCYSYFFFGLKQFLQPHFALYYLQTYRAHP